MATIVPSDTRENPYDLEYRPVIHLRGYRRLHVPQGQAGLGMVPVRGGDPAMSGKPIGEHIAAIKAAVKELDRALTEAEDDGYEIYDGANGLGRDLDFSITAKCGREEN